MTIEYRVVEREGCTLVFGAMPADAFSMFAKKIGRGGVLDTDLARMAGADFAFGKQQACAALKAKLASGAEARAAQEHPSLPIEATRWLASGERGASSDAIFYQLTGVATGDKTSHPHDPADLRRCRLLLEQGLSRDMCKNAL